MILFPHEFELYSAWVAKIYNDYGVLIGTGVERERIETIKITDYSNDSGTMTKAYATIEISSDRKIIIPKGVTPTSTNVYENNETKEVVTTLNYVFDVDKEI